ncbi:MAG: hypothetical protein ACK5YR_01160 [Pirellula sp.]
MAIAGPMQVATARRTLQVSVGSFPVGVSLALRSRAPTRPLGPRLAPKDQLRRLPEVARVGRDSGFLIEHALPANSEDSSDPLTALAGVEIREG